MPGIVGIFGRRGGQRNHASLDVMVRTMAYEKFFNWGTYENELAGVWIGWVWHKGSISDYLPIWNRSRDACLIFVGEHFADDNYGKGAERVSDTTSASNAHHLIALYEELGISFLQRLNGHFAGVLIDLRKHEATLFNDRYGLIRVYYHQDEDGLYFASEAKALLEILPETREVHHRSLAEFVSLGCVLQNRSLFRGIDMLPGASAWTFSIGRKVTQAQYFDKAEWEQLSPLSSEEYAKQLSTTWPCVVSRYFSGDRRVGLSMTGGLDSRMILAWARHARGALPCYTFGGRYRESVDVKLAREVARICQQPHQVLSVGSDFLSEFPRLAAKAVFVSDGAMDVSGAIDVYVQMLARQIAPVRLSGVNGGELLRGLVAFKPRSLSGGVLSPEFARLADAAAETYEHEIADRRLSFIAFKQAPWYMSAKFAIEHSQIVFRTPYFDNDLARLAFRAPPDLAASKMPALRLIAEGNPALGRLETDRGLSFRAIPGLTQALHQFQEFTFKAEYAYDYGMPQWLARIDGGLAFLHLERLFLGRHKFHHFRMFYRHELAPYIREVLLDARSRERSYVDSRAVERAVIAHSSGRGNYTTEIHKMLTCELIHRLFIDRRAGTATPQI